MRCLCEIVLTVVWVVWVGGRLRGCESVYNVVVFGGCVILLLRDYDIECMVCVIVQWLIYSMCLALYVCYLALLKCYAF